MPNTDTTRDSDYYRRIGGYQGPVKVTSKQVQCPDCRSLADEPCAGTQGPLKRPHKARIEFAADLTARGEADTITGRWYRSEFRKGNFPTPPLPHGTYAAFQRHKRNGEEPCDPCLQAARETWRKAKANA